MNSLSVIVSSSPSMSSINSDVFQTMIAYRMLQTPIATLRNKMLALSLKLLASFNERAVMATVTQTKVKTVEFLPLIGWLLGDFCAIAIPDVARCHRSNSKICILIENYSLRW